jgi:pyrroloquinoline quinone biosynthesis protein D
MRLAAGMHLRDEQADGTRLVLVCPEGNVQLNETAAAILRLCDGSRHREEIVAAVLSAGGQAQRTEIIEFLDAALARGWIHES